MRLSQLFKFLEIKNVCQYCYIRQKTVLCRFCLEEICEDCYSDPEIHDYCLKDDE